MKMFSVSKVKVPRQRLSVGQSTQLYTKLAACENYNQSLIKQVQRTTEQRDKLLLALNEITVQPSTALPPHVESGVDNVAVCRGIAQGAINDFERGSKKDTSIRCFNCGKLFDVATCRIHDRKLPNTLTPLNDIHNPGVECPHCGYISGELPA